MAIVMVGPRFDYTTTLNRFAARVIPV